MNRRRWMICGLLGGLGWAWLGLGLAQAESILPTDPTTLRLSADASVTVSLYQRDSDLPVASTLTLKSPSRCTTTGTAFYKEVTDCWLPEWNPANGGKSVFVVINGVSDVPTLVSPVAATFPLTPLPGTAVPPPNPFLAALTTSAYPGQCTNIGAGPDTGPDFTLTLANPQPTLPVTGLVYELKPNDCGGVAVIQVGSRKFLLPKDGSATVAANGLPDVWEKLYGGSQIPTTDIDTGPAASSPVGDGLSTSDEYRGFIVSGKQIRTDPKQKDLFLYVVNHADSPTSTSSNYATYPIGESLFALVYTLVAPERLHLLGPDATNPLKTKEWVDNFVSLIPAQTLSISDSVTDRTVNSNRLYGLLGQKGVRVMEALNTNSSSLLGWSYGVASPNEAGNVAVFTQRIINYINSLIVSATTRKYSTASLVSGVWTWSMPAVVDRNFILSKAFQFYTGHEIHHSLDLTPGVQGTNKAPTAYGHHFAPGTGDCQDQAITTTSKGGTVTFYIPSLCGTADQTQFVLR